ncbi:hypothetical protein PAXRUDRAFT_109269, partial [Paxillus rubicundulus Ve08.2h10]
EVVLLVPQAANEGAQRISILQWTAFAKVLEVIHETIGCQNVACKPLLSYKLSTAPQKADSINISTSEDWQGCLEEVNAVERKKKGSYMSSLRAMNKKKPIKGKRPMLLDLDNEDGSDDEEDDGMAEKEKKALEELENILWQCQLCGPSKLCKIDRTGQHVNLKFQQRRGWSVALATGTHGVTLKSPPKGDLFANFHSLRSTGDVPVSGQNSPLTTSTITHPTHLPYPYSMGPGGYGPWMQMPMTPSPWMMALNTPHTPTRRRHDKHMPSSDPPQQDRLHYPPISEFLDKLDIEHPRRTLPMYAGKFEALDSYDIDELASLTEDRLTSTELGMSIGNARFLLREVKDEMKRVDQKKHAQVE